jgi:hypothetical protein
MHTTLHAIAVAALSGLALLAGGCAELEKYREQIEEIRAVVRQLRGLEPAPRAPTPPEGVRPELPTVGLTIKGSCVARDESGYAENVQLDVSDGRVRQFDARVDVPKRGSCRFQLVEFQQTKLSPHVELVARTSAACVIRMWQQGDRVTVTANDCAEKCARGAFEYVWPMQLDRATGGCY